jgi:adenine specific DNA methylase Mod
MDNFSKTIRGTNQKNMKIKMILILAIITLFSISALAQKNTSVYTNLNEKSCKTLESNPNEAGSYRGRCPGIGGYMLDLLEGDLRQSINVIAPNKKTFELNFWQIFSSFSAVGQKAEWRMKGKTPVALIFRYNVSDPEDSAKNTSYLFVTKVTKTEVCVTDVVKPSKTQNAEAQKLADIAATKPCKATE